MVKIYSVKINSVKIKYKLIISMPSPQLAITQNKSNTLQPIQPQPSQAPQGVTLSSHNTTSNPLPLTTQDYYFSSNKNY